MGPNVERPNVEHDRTQKVLFSVQSSTFKLFHIRLLRSVFPRIVALHSIAPSNVEGSSPELPTIFVLKICLSYFVLIAHQKHSSFAKLVQSFLYVRFKWIKIARGSKSPKFLFLNLDSGSCFRRKLKRSFVINQIINYSRTQKAAPSVTITKLIMSDEERDEIKAWYFYSDSGMKKRFTGLRTQNVNLLGSRLVPKWSEFKCFQGQTIFLTTAIPNLTTIH